MSSTTTSHGYDPVDALCHCSEGVGQLREALQSRTVIDQAEGVLMAHDGFSADDTPEPAYHLELDSFDTRRAKDSRGSAA